MDKETLLQSLGGTLDSSFQIRKQSEQQLHLFEQQPGFTAYLLDLITEPDVTLKIQISAAIFFKNRIANYWVIPENRTSSELTIQDNEKPIIKEKLITAMIKTYRNNQIKLQLATALHNILNSDKWEEMIPTIKNLLSGGSDHVFVGLTCLFEYTKNYRWSGLESSSSSNPVLEDIALEIFPMLEVLANNLITEGAEMGDEMLYLIVKIFKFTTFSYLPTYLQNPANLGNWCQLQIVIINSPLPASVMEEESPEIRSSNPRVKTVKWCFGNLHRLLSRHGGGFSTKEKNNQFTKDFLEHFVPEILNAYWKIIEAWSVKKVWLSEGSLFHMISFLEQLIETPAWALISDKLEAIVKHVILPTLNATEQSIELYEDDQEEYIRRFFDINREANTSDVASINFIFRLSNKKFKSTIGLLLNILNDVFTRRASDRSNLEVAMETEGSLRILATVSYKLDKKSSPVQGQLDQILHTFVYPELSKEAINHTPWLTARACDTLAMFVYKYQNQQVLEDIFQGIVNCFQNQDHFPVQLTAVDALRTLVDEDSVADHIAVQAPQLMGTLLDMSKKFESDILTSVMDSFVEKFAKNLEPYAHELSSRLVEQFLKLATELLEKQNSDSSNYDVDKEYQASGILNTLTTLVIAMNTSPEVAASLENVLQNMIKFILENAMVAFLTEAIEILESILFSTQKVSPILWNLYQVCIDSFDTYAFEYFDTFQPFFESVINNGFTSNEITIDLPQVQSLLKVCFNILNSESIDPVFAHCAFELIELMILALNTRFTSFLPRFLPEIYTVFSALEAQDAFDGYMLHHLSILKVFFACLYVDSVTTVQFLNENQFTAIFYKLWIKHSDDFRSVYGCKIQILAAVSIINGGAIALIPEDFVGETVDLLLSNLEVLPNAIKARNEILSQEHGLKQYTGVGQDEDDEDDEYGGAYYEEDDYEADEAELEAMKQTPIDSINVFEVFANQTLALQLQDPTKYQTLYGGIEQSQSELINHIIKINEEQK